MTVFERACVEVFGVVTIFAICAFLYTATHSKGVQCTNDMSAHDYGLLLDERGFPYGEE